MFKIKIILFLLPFSMASQNIKGKVYDYESTAKGILIFNSTQNIKTFSDENGDFTISASIKDSLKFSSLFHQEKFIKVSKEHFDYKLVVELKKEVHELGEVLLNSDEKPKAFDPIDYTQQVSFGLKEDMKRNPHLYSPSNGNILALLGEITKLFKNENRNKKATEPSIKTISYKTFDSLFSNDRFFNKKLLKEDLHIPDPLKPLFFDYCDAKGLSTNLLEKQNQLIFLDSLLHFSKYFKTITDTSKKD